MTRGEAAERLWQAALASEDARIDLARAGAYIDIALRLLCSGTPPEQHAAAGLLARMAHAGQNSNLSQLLHRARVSRVLGAIAAILRPDRCHLRSKISAAELLQAISTRPDAAPLLVSLVPCILALLAERGPDWAGLHEARASAAVALANVLHALSQPAAAQKRPGVLASAMAPLLNAEAARTLLANTRRGQHALTSAASACLLHAARCPEWKASFLGEHGLQECARLVTPSNGNRKAAMLALLHNAALDEAYMPLLASLGVCAIASRALQAMLCEAAPQGPAASGPCALRKRAGPLPPHADSIICHAAALLCAMSRNDACKVQLREGGAARLLLLARASRNLRTYESCTAALWNIGLEPGSDEHLVALAAPPFLCAPVPASWQATDNDAYLLPRGLGAAAATPAVGHHPTWDVSYHEAASAAA